MQKPRHALAFSLVFIAMVQTSCVSKTKPEKSLTDRIEAAEEAFENDAIDKAALLKILLETDMVRGRLGYEKNRLMIARSSGLERLHDPPRHYRHREMLDKARESNEIKEREYMELNKLVETAHNAWLDRRRKVMRDRAIWRFPN
ncbi:MAG: hypothetical protein VB980_02065 [Opitutales bacterium]